MSWHIVKHTENKLTKRSGYNFKEKSLLAIMQSHTEITELLQTDTPGLSDFKSGTCDSPLLWVGIKEVKVWIEFSADLKLSTAAGCN